MKPRRHVVHVSELDVDESAELGPLLVRVARAVERHAGAEQVYVALWSHMGGVPVHIHFVVQPMRRALRWIPTRLVHAFAHPPDVSGSQRDNIA